MVGDRESRDPGRGASSGESVQREAGRTADTVKERVGDVAEETRREGGRLLGEVGDRVKGEADGQARRAAASARDMSSQMRSMASGGAQPDGAVAGLMRDGADRVESFADRLDSGGWEAAWTDVERFARRRPGVFLAGAFGVGVLAGRLFRNTDTEEVRRQMTEDTRPGDRAEERPYAASSERAAPLSESDEPAFSTRTPVTATGRENPDDMSGESPTRRGSL